MRMLVDVRNSSTVVSLIFTLGVVESEGCSTAGCGGGENLFLSLTECVNVCMKEETISPPAPPPPQTMVEPTVSEGDICSLPAMLPGPLGCLSFQTKWSYSKSEGGCVKKSYGGCGATANLFDSQEECQQTCRGLSSASTTAEVCSLPLLPGPCKQLQPSYGFNSLTGRCEPFSYGGEWRLE